MSGDLEEEVRERIAVLTDDPYLRDAATEELFKRLWCLNSDLPPRTRSRKDTWPRDKKPLLRREAHPIEMLIVQALSRTWGAAQFGASPNNSVFTADTDGYSGYNGRRDVLTGLSPLLDDVARQFNAYVRDGRGGRFYLRDGTFFDAEERLPFLHVDVRVDACDYSGRMDVGYRSFTFSGKGVWKRVTGLFR